MQIFLELLVLLLVTRLFSEGAERIGQPVSIGELVAGIVLAACASLWGSTVPFFEQLTMSKTLEEVAHLGIFFIVLLAGIESEPQELQQHSGSAFIVAFGGAIVPLICGFYLAWEFLPPSEVRSIQALLVGVTMSITSIPATMKVLTEFGLLHTRLGQTVVGAAIVDDVLGLFILAILTSMVQTGQPPDHISLLFLLGKVVMFFTITISLGVHVYPRVSRGLKALQSAALEFSALMGVGLAYGLLAELLGMHWILGAFMAGLYFEPGRVGYKAYQEIKLIVTGIARGFLGPLFFATIGLHVNFGALTGVPFFLGLIIFTAFFGKLIGSGLPAYWLGFDRREALAVGVGMSSRGAVELVVLSIAYEAGVFTYGSEPDPIVTYLYSALVFMVVAATFFTLVILRRILPRASI